jgi:hypothetical protein
MHVTFRRIEIRCFVIAVVAGLWTTPTAGGAGFIRNENFTVYTPDQPPSQELASNLARAVLDKAEQCRKQIALEWLGEELPPSVGPTMINVRFSDEPNKGLTWAKDHPDRKYHALFLVVSGEEAIDDLLSHEMVHCVLATRFPHPRRLPAWIEEGIASRYDGPTRQAVRQKLVQWFVSTGNWPRLNSVLGAESIPPHDQEAYAVCTTVTDVLLKKGDKKMLIRFAGMVEQAGLDRALNECYGIRSIDELESLWKSSLAGSTITSLKR